MVGAAGQAPGIGRTGMISTASPGKIVKCGCFSNSLAAASCDFRPHDHEGAHLVAHVLDAAFVDFLRLAEWPAIGGNRRVVRFDPGFQAAMPSCSLARLSASGSAIQAFMRGLVLLPSKTAR